MVGFCAGNGVSTPSPAFHVPPVEMLKSISIVCRKVFMPAGRLMRRQRKRAVGGLPGHINAGVAVESDRRVVAGDFSFDRLVNVVPFRADKHRIIKREFPIVPASIARPSCVKRKVAF